MRTPCIFLMTALLMLAQSCSTDNEESNDNAFFGTWRIAQIQVSQQQLAQFSPADENIFISFNEGGSFTGETMSNQFSGRYQLEGNTLTLLEFTSTEAGDTVFAGAFYEAVTAAQVPNETFAQFGYSLEGQNLVLVFGNSGRMVLEEQP